MRILVANSSKTVRTLWSPGDMAWDYLGGLCMPKGGMALGYAQRHALPFAADNAAFTNFDRVAFVKMCAKMVGTDVMWVVSPDKVGDAAETLRRFAIWEPWMREMELPVAFVAQDGIENEAIPWDKFDCWFVGGTDAFKCCDASRQLIIHAKGLGKLTHVGRVNTLDRVRWCLHTGAVDSIDGSGLTNYAATYLPKFIGVIASHENDPRLFSDNPLDTPAADATIDVDA